MNAKEKAERQKAETEALLTIANALNALREIINGSNGILYDHENKEANAQAERIAKALASFPL